MNKKNKIIVEIKGGFGNQLFQFLFAKSLKDKGYKVYVNTRFYDYKNKETKLNTPRKQILNEEIFGFRNIGYLTFKYMNLNKRLNESKYLNKFFTNNKNPLYSKFKDSNYLDNKFYSKIVHLDGYWQNKDYVLKNKNFLMQSLKKVKDINDSLNLESNKDTVLMLVRKGDYVKMKEDLTLSFYKNAIDYLKNEIQNFELNIYTDDVEWVKNQEIFKISKNIYGPEIEPDGVLKLFSNMISNKHFIIGNSTFSFFASVLGEKTDSIILIAYPWFRHKNYPDLYFDNWKKIRNE